MTITRRRFLTKAASSVATLTAASLAVDARSANSTATAPNSIKIDANSDWSLIRSQFNLDPSYTHLAGLLLASHPKCVRDAIERYRTALDENPVDSHNRLGNDHEVLKQAALYMDAEPTSLALTDSTTMGLGLMYGGLKLNRGDHVLTTSHDHYATRESLRLSTKRQGAVLETISLYEDGKNADTKQIVKTIMSHLKPNTCLLALTWVHSGTGVELPIREISEALKRTNQSRKRPVLFFVDGVHGFGVENLSVKSLGCDVFIAGCHKWLFGPRGTGVIWANERALDSVEPIIPTFDWPLFQSWIQGKTRGKDDKAVQLTPGGFHSFEHRWALDEAFKFHLAIGKERIQKRIHTLNTHLKTELAKLPRVKLHTPMDSRLSAGIVTFEVEGKSSKDVGKALRADRIIGSETPYAQSYARLTPGILNNEHEVENAIKAVSKI